MTAEERYKALERRHDRLRVAAERVVHDAQAIGTLEAPLCGVRPWHIRVLRNELDGTPQASGFMTMSAS
jgi:hypothetical protein